MVSPKTTKVTDQYSSINTIRFGRILVISTITTTKYIRKPLYVDAVQVTAENFDEVATWCQGEVQKEGEPGKETGKKFIKVRVMNPMYPRQTQAFVGDWILYTERGYKVYTDKTFAASFDPVSEHETTPEEVETPPITERRPSEPSGVVDTDVSVSPTEVPPTASETPDEQQAA